ncbi:MAG: hypothetical protein IJ710_03335 [Prevotella sp.]|nr:hypothetical protein [Prevotella sp.]
MNNDFELENMRQQMAMLKKKLEQQEIVNDRIIRKSMKRNVVNINRRYYAVSVLCLLMIPYGYWAFVRLNGMSVGFWAATSILMIIAFVYTLITGKHLRSKDLLNDDLLVARQKIARAMKLDHQWLKIGIPLGILWIGYFCYESFRIKELVNDGLTMCYLGIICGAVGAAVGLKIHFKTQRQYQDIIDQIEDLTAETSLNLC